MDRNSIIGLSLIFVLLIGYFFINQPSEQELIIQKRVADSIAMVKENEKNQLINEAQLKNDTSKKSTIVEKVDTSLLIAQYGELHTQLFGYEKEVVLENESLKVTFSNKGGRIKQVQLKAFKTDRKTPVLLFDTLHSESYLSYNNKNTLVKTNQFFWEYELKGNNQLVFKLKGDNNSEIISTYTIPQIGYNVEHNLTTKGLQNVISDSKLTFNWSNNIPLQEREVEKEKILTTFYFKPVEEKADYIGESNLETKVLEQDASWISFKQQFFNSSVSIDKPFLKGSQLTTAEAKSDSSVKFLTASLVLPYQSVEENSFKLNYYFGPNQYHELKKQNIGLDKIIPLGWGLFGWINRFMIIPIFTFLQQYISNYGIVILFLTLIIKTLLLPLVFKSYKSTAKMRLLKPEMDEIKEKHKDDMQAIQMENLKLYKKAGVNPLGGCLPMLLQMPILVAVFQFVPSAFEFRQQSFLWASDLSIYDSIWDFGKLPIIDTIYGDHVSLFTLLMTISTLIYTRMNNQVTGVNDQMKYISYLMPILFLGFFNKYAAALTYYYFLSNVITFTQQWAIKFFVDENKLKAQIHESKNRKDSDIKKSGFQARLEEMAKARGLDPNKKSNKK
jgi:YidC/Oxa1 family membrane protein insertase